MCGAWLCRLIVLVVDGGKCVFLWGGDGQMTLGSGAAAGA